MIEEVKKAHIGFLKDDLSIILNSIQKASCLMVIKQENNANQTLSSDGLVDKLDHTIKNLENYVTKKPLFGDYLTSSEDEFESLKNSEAYNISKEIDALLDEKLNNKKDIKAYLDEIKALSCWEKSTIPLNEICNTEQTIINCGFIETKYVIDFINYNESNGIEFEVLDEVKNLSAVWFICFKDDYEEVFNKIKSFGFVSYNLPKYNGLVKDYIIHLNELIDSLNHRNIEIDSLCTEKTSCLPDLKKYVDYLLSNKEVSQTNYLQTEEIYLIEGWVPTDKVDYLKSFLDNTNCPYDMEITDPIESDIVPTYTVNDKFVQPFESVTNMFSVPSSKEADPNPVMSIWYWILFGMMVGDVGYGAVMLIGGFLFIKLTHPTGGTLNIAKVITYSAITTILWGIFFNSYFGFEMPFYKAVIAPMTDALPMLVLSVAVGLFHIITGLILRMIKHIKSKEIQEMLGKDLSWILILLGLAVFAGSLISDSLMFLKTTGIVVIFIGVALILVFAGHENKNIIGRGLAGILGLYDATGFLGDLLSYSRIMALLMSSASVAYVMNILGGMVASSIPILGPILSVLVYVGGHIFNLVLGLLSAYVHDCRLQYIEFYGKFYDGGGIEFKPLSLKTKYIKEIKKVNNKKENEKYGN